MNSNKESGEEEEVFADAVTSPEPGPEPEPSPQADPTLRRSNRKRKSISEETTSTYKSPRLAARRPRPLGNMGGVQRSPTAAGGMGPGVGAATGTSAKKQPSRQTNKSPSEITIETDPPTETPTKEQLVLLGGMRTLLQEELRKTEDKLSNRIGGVESGFAALQGNLKSLEGRVDDIERRFEKKLDQAVDKNSNQIQSLSFHSFEQPTARENRYWAARRSLRIWPIEGDGEEMMDGLQKFLAQNLRLGEDVLADSEDCKVRRVPRGANSTIRHEVAVEFPSVDLRDVVRQAAYNLAGMSGCGIRLEIAHHLMANFKALSAASYKLKKRFSDCKRNIMYDDESLDLVLDFRTSAETGWKRLKSGHAKQMLKDEGTSEEVTADDVSHMLAGGQDE